MSYPRNAASPERVDIGAVVQISDGAVQTSGVAVKVIPSGGVEASGGGTIAYSADGVVLYTPTQAETDYTSFVLIASKSACIPASKTVITSASATAGYAGTDQSKIANATATVNLSGTTIKTATDVETDTQDIQGRLPAALESGRIAAVLDSTVSTKIDNIQDAAGWLLAISSGAVANPQTATEQYDITQFGVNYRVAMAGLTSTGTRTAPTLSKPA